VAETTTQHVFEDGRVPSNLSTPRSSNERNLKEETERVLPSSNDNADDLNDPLIRLIGDMNFSPGSEVKEDVVVEGSLIIGDRCSLLRSVKAYGDITVGSDVFIGENLVARGNVSVGKGTVIKGSIDAQGSVKLGENVLVECSVVAGGDVELQENSQIGRGTFVQGCVRAGSKPKLRTTSR